MPGLARMGRAGQGQLLAREPVRRAALDQRQRLYRLDGGARKHRPLDIAEREQDAPVGVANHARPAMEGLDKASAQNLDDDRIVQRAPRFS
jgi:hypothetical protein